MTPLSHSANRPHQPGKGWLRTLVLLVLLFASAPAWASGITEILVFGDSLSDQGNANDVSLGVIPNDDYHDSRVFSNGPVWIETLATRLGAPIPQHSLAGGSRATNYAYGGAETGDNISNDLRDLGAQIDAFIEDERTISASTLTVLWIGGNDLNGTGPNDAQAKVAATIARVDEHITEVITLGARHLLIPNLPMLGEVPQHNGNASDRENHNNMSASYNEELHLLVDGLRFQFPDVRIVTLDIAGIFDELLLDPASFGFVNTTDMAHTQGPLYPLTLFSSTVSNPNSYVFWDDLHPTGPVHRLLGERAASTVQEAAVPPLTELSIAADDVAVSFESSDWDLYFLERSTDLETWTRIATDVPGNGGIVTVVHEGGSGEATAFYRIGVE